MFKSPKVDINCREITEDIESVPKELEFVIEISRERVKLAYFFETRTKRTRGFWSLCSDKQMKGVKKCKKSIRVRGYSQLCHREPLSVILIS